MVESIPRLLAESLPANSNHIADQIYPFGDAPWINNTGRPCHHRLMIGSILILLPQQQPIEDTTLLLSPGPSFVQIYMTCPLRNVSHERLCLFGLIRSIWTCCLWALLPVPSHLGRRRKGSIWISAVGLTFSPPFIGPRGSRRVPPTRRIRSVTNMFGVAVGENRDSQGPLHPSSLLVGLGGHQGISHRIVVRQGSIPYYFKYNRHHSCRVSLLHEYGGLVVRVDVSDHGR